MRGYRLLVVLAVSLLAGTIQGSQGAKPKSADAGVTAAEYAIYSVLIDEAKSIFGTGGLRPGYTLVVVQDRTSAGPDGEGGKKFFQRLSHEMPGLTRQTCDAFLARNKGRHPLKNLFKTKAKCVLISDREERAIFDKGGWWPQFYRKYPKSQGILTLSRAGFNSANDQALVYVGDQSDGLAGAGYCVLLAKKRSAWTIQGKAMLWIS